MRSICLLICGLAISLSALTPEQRKLLREDPAFPNHPKLEDVFKPYVPNHNPVNAPPRDYIYSSLTPSRRDLLRRDPAFPNHPRLTDVFQTPAPQTHVQIDPKKEPGNPVREYFYTGGYSAHAGDTRRVTHLRFNATTDHILPKGERSNFPTSGNHPMNIRHKLQANSKGGFGKADDRGHMATAKEGGTADFYNHAAQHSDVNRGGLWRKMEKERVSFLKNAGPGTKRWADVHIQQHYNEDSMRPRSFTVHERHHSHSPFRKGWNVTITHNRKFNVPNVPGGGRSQDVLDNHSHYFNSFGDSNKKSNKNKPNSKRPRYNPPSEPHIYNTRSQTTPRPPGSSAGLSNAFKKMRIGKR